MLWIIVIGPTYITWSPKLILQKHSTKSKYQYSRHWVKPCITLFWTPLQDFANCCWKSTVTKPPYQRGYPEDNRSEATPAILLQQADQAIGANSWKRRAYETSGSRHLEPWDLYLTTRSKKLQHHYWLGHLKAQPEDSSLKQQSQFQWKFLLRMTSSNPTSLAFPHRICSHHRDHAAKSSHQPGTKTTYWQDRSITELWKDSYFTTDSFWYDYHCDLLSLIDVDIVYISDPNLKALIQYKKKKREDVTRCVTADHVS